MNATDDNRAIDEAAVWIARLRAPDRGGDVERGFRLWLNESDEHKDAYETITTAWELTAGLKRKPFPKLSRWERAGFRAGFVKATLAVAAAAAVVAIGTVYYFRHAGFATEIGEQRTLALSDGSRIYLNTATRVVTEINERERRIQLKAGEALFDVAKDPTRPFTVTVGDRTITALGTSFVVRYDPERTAVTLIDGKVSVALSPSSLLPPGEGGESSSRMRDLRGTEASARQPMQAPDPSSVILTPGERLVIAARAAPKLDRPSIEKETAWRRGQVELTDTPLADAVEEMNRYSESKLVVESPEGAEMRINGVFRAGDTQGFAAAVSRSYGFAVHQSANEIVLSAPK